MSQMRNLIGFGIVDPLELSVVPFPSGQQFVSSLNTGLMWQVLSCGQVGYQQYIKEIFVESTLMNDIVVIVAISHGHNNVGKDSSNCLDSKVEVEQFLILFGMSIGIGIKGDKDQDLSIALFGRIVVIIVCFVVDLHLFQSSEKINPTGMSLIDVVLNQSL